MLVQFLKKTTYRKSTIFEPLKALSYIYNNPIKCRFLMHNGNANMSMPH